MAPSLIISLISGAFLGGVAARLYYIKKIRDLANDVYFRLDLGAALICADHTKPLRLNDVNFENPTSVDDWGWDSEEAKIRYLAWEDAKNSAGRILKKYGR